MTEIVTQHMYKKLSRQRNVLGAACAALFILVLIGWLVAFRKSVPHTVSSSDFTQQSLRKAGKNVAVFVFFRLGKDGKDMLKPLGISEGDLKSIMENALLSNGFQLHEDEAVDFSRDYVEKIHFDLELKVLNTGDGTFVYSISFSASDMGTILSGHMNRLTYWQQSSIGYHPIDVRFKQKLKDEAENASAKLVNYLLKRLSK